MEQYALTFHFFREFGHSPLVKNGKSRIFASEINIDHEFPGRKNLA
jgi:hypothetical protein